MTLRCWRYYPRRDRRPSMHRVEKDLHNDLEDVSIAQPLELVASAGDRWEPLGSKCSRHSDPQVLVGALSRAPRSSRSRACALAIERT
jgi:hypothetical protein